MKRLSFLVVGLASYLLFLLAALYTASFTLGGLLPDPVVIPHVTPVSAFLVDVGLIVIFGLQHSVMARESWKARWTSIVSPALERSVFVLIASCIILAMFWFWQPISGVIWKIDSTLVWILVNGVCLIGWGIVLWSTFQMDHFELFGLRQIWRAIRGQPMTPPTFRIPLLYRFARHPMMTGFLVVFWATPNMTVDRLVLAVGMTVYILIGLAFEERALRRQFGSVYEQYQASVPRLIPIPRKLSILVQTKPKHTPSGSMTSE